MEDVVILTSGGIDSSVLFYWLLDKNYNPYPIYINYGQCYSNSEFKGLNDTLPLNYGDRLKYFDLNPIYSSKTSPPILKANLWEKIITDEELRLPYRNLVMLSLAAAYAESKNISKVFAGFIKVKQVKGDDCSNPFFDSLNKIFNIYGNIQVCLPFINFTKEDVVSLGISLNVPLHYTYSCLVNTESPCGVCGNCIDRKFAFSKLRTKYDRSQL